MQTAASATMLNHLTSCMCKSAFFIKSGVLTIYWARLWKTLPKVFFPSTPVQRGCVGGCLRFVTSAKVATSSRKATIDCCRGVSSKYQQPESAATSLSRVSWVYKVLAGKKAKRTSASKILAVCGTWKARCSSCRAAGSDKFRRHIWVSLPS